MTEHDQRVCLRCGKPAGDLRFCESCCAQLDSFRENLIRVGARAVGREEAVAAEDLRGGAGEVDKLPGSAQEHPDQPPQNVARLEEVLTPKHLDAELAACLQADAAGSPGGATNLGVLLEERGDREGALAAYRRADRRGDVDGAFNLGCLLAEMGDAAGARVALQRADARGDGAAASNLGVLLEQEGDLDGALAAYRRGDERGDATAAFNLGLLLAGRGDLAGARAAYRRAGEADDPELRERAAQAAAELPPPGPDPEETETPTADEPEIAPAEVHPAPPAGGSPRRWIAALCLLALAAVLVARRFRR